MTKIKPHRPFEGRALGDGKWDRVFGKRRVPNIGKIATNTNINWLALVDRCWDSSVNQLLCIVQILDYHLQEQQQRWWALHSLLYKSSGGPLPSPPQKTKSLLSQDHEWHQEFPSEICREIISTTNTSKNTVISNLLRDDCSHSVRPIITLLLHHVSKKSSNW